MARKRRSSEQYGWFHVTTRGVDRCDIFSDRRDRERFIEEMVAAATRFDVEIHGFSLMSNHVHVLVHCPEGGVSDMVQRMLKRYVEFHNPRVDRVGHLFGGRFTSTLIDDEPDLDATAVFQQVARYVHRNPLDRMPLDQIRNDPFTSYGAYLGTLPKPAWLHVERLLGSFDDDRDQLRSFTENPHPSDKTPREGCRIDAYDPHEVVTAVAAVTGVDREVLLCARTGQPNPGRDLAAHLAYRLRTGSTRQLAGVFGLVSQSAFRRLAARGKDRCALDPVWAETQQRVLAQLWSAHLAAERTAVSTVR